MGSFSIGLSGLQVAQRLMDVVSSNIANATTEGYHRQEAVVRPIVLKHYGGVGIGGAEVTEIKRSINNLLELEITRHQGNFSQASEELNVLRTVEAAFGEIGSGGLAVAIDKFFNSLTELAADPQNEAMRIQTVWAGDAMAGEFRNIGQFLADVEVQVKRQAEGFITEFNNLATEVDDVTDEMVALSARGGTSNLLADRRDQAVRKMAELADIQIGGTGEDMVESLRISAWGTPVVSRASQMELEVVAIDNGDLAVGAKDSEIYQSTVRGGKIGAMLEMKNDILGGIRSDLDALANQIMSAINSIHIQGVGSSGSFTELDGVAVSDQALSEWDLPVVDGSIYVRVTNTNTGVVTRSQIDIDVTDTLTDVTALLDGVNGLSASVSLAALKLDADNGFTFDFLPELHSEPYTSAVTGDAPVTISGIYTEQTNQIYTARVVGTGQVGIAADLSLEVRDAGGELIKRLNVGQGYAAGESIDIGLGMMVAFGSGQLNVNDEFTIQALGDTDTSGFLNAAGINTFFSGSSAHDMAMRSEIMDDPSRRLAVSWGSAATDSESVGRMIDVGESSYAALGDKSIQDFYRGIVTGVGQSVVVREARASALDNVIMQLNTQRDDISGVDINEETAKLITLERMFQGMARVIAAQDESMDELMQLI
jgi:flagellar hook-associated protein 1 FlgK